MKIKPKSRNFKPQPPLSTINLHVVDSYYHVWYKFFFGILNVSGSIGYPFNFGFGSDILITRNTIKQDPFGIYVGFRSVRIHFYRIGLGLFAQP
ncbi:unnamed protein product, partial [Brassica rapa]